MKEITHSYNIQRGDTVLIKHYIYDDVIHSYKTKKMKLTKHAKEEFDKWLRPYVREYYDISNINNESIIEWFTDYKKTLKCKECGESRYWVLDFHHRDPKEKDVEVSTLMRRGNKTKILKEIEKCDVLCANCHRDLHFKENNADFA